MKTISRSVNILIAVLLALTIGLQNTGTALADGLTDQTITVDTPAPASAVYGATFTVAASATSGLDVSYSSSGSCTNVGTLFTMSAGSGTCTVQYDQAGDATYNPASQVTEDVTAEVAAITVTADPQGKTYGQSDPTLTYQVTAGALVGGDAFTGELTRDAGEDVGDHAITQGSLALSADYNLTYQGANLTIAAAPITVTADPQSKFVGDPDPALTYQVTSGALVGADAFTGLLTRDPGETNGTYAIRQGTLALSANYTLSYVGANLTITTHGPVIITGNAGVAGAKLSYVNGTAKSVTSNSKGTYIFSVPYRWSGTVTPSKTGYKFAPAFIRYAPVTSNKTAQNYALVRYTISGKTGVGGVVLTYTEGTVKKVRSAADGSYAISVLAYWSGTVTPSLYGYTFLPAQKAYTRLVANSTAQNYRAVLITVSTPGAPTGVLVNTPNPRFVWSKIVTATNYQIQVWNGSRLMYTQTTDSSVCGSFSCSTVPGTSLANSTYMWKVRARVGGVWKGYSVPQIFTLVTKPLSGFWSGSFETFFVDATRTLVEQFSIYVTVPDCGHTYKITQNVVLPIRAMQFSFGGAFYASGLFYSPTYATGSTGLTRFPISGCGLVNGGPWSWTADWVSAAPRSSIQPAEVTPLQISPEQTGFPQVYTVERVAP